METAIAKDEFQILLDAFHKVINGSPEPEKVKDDLDEIKESASLSNELTFWQKDAIIKRCDNYSNGDYGSTSRDTKSYKK